MKFFSLKNKILLTVILVIFVMGSIAVAFVYVFTKNEMVEIEKNNLESITAEQTQEIEQVLIAGQDLVATIAKRTEIISYLKEQGVASRPDISNILNGYNINDQYSAIYIMNSDGLTLNSTDTSFIGKNYSFRDYFKDAMQGYTGLDVAIGVTSKKFGYYFSQPVIFNDQIIGVVVAKMKPERIVQAAIENSPLRNNANIFFIDEFGVILHSNIAQFELQSFGKLEPIVREKIQEKNRYPGIDILPLFYPELQNEVNKGYQQRSFEFYNTVEKQTAIYVFAKVDHSQFSIIIERSMDDLINKAAKSALIVSLFVMLAALLAMVIIAFLLNRFLLPLNKITEAFKDMEKGNIKVRIDITSNDELGNLARGFNSMSDKLNILYKDLDKKVKEKTEKLDEKISDLERLNKALIGREKKMIEMKQSCKPNNKNKK